MIDREGYYYPRVCERCGIKYSPTSPVQRFCTPECLALFKEENLPLKKCKTCGKSFPSNGQVYCSLKCYYIRPRVSKICLNCGVEFSGKNMKKRKFCSKTCAGQYKTLSLEDLTIYGELYHYRKSQRWKDLRLEILIRDNFECQHCGINSYGAQLHVHHIKPLRDFWPNRVRDSERPDNLITVCVRCHPRIETAYIQCPVPKG